MTHALKPLRPLRRFDYMALAKRMENQPGYFLQGSTMPRPTPQECGWEPSDYALSAMCDSYGEPRVLDALYARFKVHPRQIAITSGASEANALLCQALLSPGDEVLAETPGYEVFHILPEVFFSKWVPLPRREENCFQPDPAEVKRLLTPKTKLVILTDMHNPTGVKLELARLKAICGAALQVGAYVLVDEIYLDHLEPGAHPDTCFHFAPNIIVTSSLTKVYGLGLLRAGFMFGPEAFISRVLDLIDLNAVEQPGITQNLAAKAYTRLPELRKRSRALYARGLPVLREWARSRSDITLLKPPGGITASIKVAGITDSGALCDFLAAKAGVLVAPGSAFQMPEWLRVNFAREPEWLREAYAALGRGIDAYKSQAK